MGYQTNCTEAPTSHILEQQEKVTDVVLSAFILQACFASLVSQDYVNGTDQEEIRTGE